jgi:hypothetical protein
VNGPEGKRRPRSRSDPDPSPEEALEPSELKRQIQFLEEETALLRRRLQDSPRQVHVLEERLLETKGQLAQALSQNERLAATLREGREQIIALKEEVERLTRPPLQFGLLLEMDKSGEWADIRFGGRKLRVGVHKQVDSSSALPGDEVLLGEQMSVVDIKTMGESREADQRKLQHSQHPSETHPRVDERMPNSDPGSGLSSFNRFRYNLRQGHHPPISRSLTSSRGNGSFAVFLNSLNDLDDIR